MGFRFRKRLSLAPKVRLNIGKRSVGLSLGDEWAGVNVGRSGVRGRLSAPSTGMSYTTDDYDGIDYHDPTPRSANLNSVAFLVSLAAIVAGLYFWNVWIFAGVFFGGVLGSIIFERAVTGRID
jgi:hypothetical protein